MDLTKLTAKEFGRIVKLLRRKESLEKKLGQVERSVAKVVGAGASLVARRARRIASGRGRSQGRRGRPKGRRSTGRKFGRRGGLRKVVLAQLKRAGKAGLKIKDLAGRMNIQRQRLDTWFYQNVKKVRGLRKIGPGHYHLRG
ncbi:MAG: hypothetical protein EBS49_07195 [Verrucomicrobia bacterium]|nr:hypothetical protein [Verrucomicrobiota bacterium]NBR64103.1 hypothetical protein [Verrucomicrobiota bacterium]NBU69379.1 hypothetical protein [Verrucomicrobiota bacterium]